MKATKISGVLEVKLPQEELPLEERRAAFEKWLEVAIQDIRDAYWREWERLVRG